MTMKQLQVLLLTTVGICMATTPDPLGFPYSLLDRVGDAAKAGVATRASALEILERVAEGRMEGGSPDLEVQVGLKSGQLRGPEFRGYELRSYAFRRIGELDLPEALTYLQNLKESDIGPDTSGQIRSAAQIALLQAQVNRIPDQQAKIRFLEEATSGKGAGVHWAVDELCNLGSYQSLPLIRARIHRLLSLPQDIEHENGFCEARMGVVSRDPDRVRALGAVLRVNGGGTDPQLTGWAIGQLRAMRSERADAELERYAKEIDALPADSPVKRDLASRLPLRYPK
jgi:hypothetical protein